jgi:hypothetical protein
MGALSNINHKQIKSLYVLCPLILLIVISMFPVIIIAQTASIPDWVKNNAIWRTEEKIP